MHVKIISSGNGLVMCLRFARQSDYEGIQKQTESEGVGNPAIVRGNIDA